MPGEPGRDDPLFSTRWVHLFEEDTADGEVFVPETTAVPLSRRPRERLQLEPDGSASIMSPGPDDRPSPRPARWAEQGGDLVVRALEGGGELRIVQRSPERLIVRSS